MARTRKLLAIGFSIVLIGLTAAQASAQQASSISFADSDPLSIRVGATEAVEIHNNTSQSTSVKLTVGSDQVVTFDKTDNKLTEGGTLAVKLTAVKQGTGWLVAVDQNDTSHLIRRKIIVPKDEFKPALTALTPSTTIGVTEESADIGALPLTSPTTCPVDDKPSTGTVANGNDVAHVTASCKLDGDKAVFALHVSGLDPMAAGVYRGTLPVGTTDVAIEFTRSAPALLAVSCLLLGVVIALIGRSLTGRRPVMAARQEIASLQRLEPPGSRWQETVHDHFARTTERLLGTMQDDNLWARWQVRPVRWLFVPAAAASAKIDSTRAEVAALAEATADWNTNAATEWRLLTQNTAALPTKLRARARAIVAGSSGAMVEPYEPDDPRPEVPRTGISGLTAVLTEARALNTVAQFLNRLGALEQLLATPAPQGQEDAYADLLSQNRAQARISIVALRARANRCVDARKLLADGFAGQLEAAAALVDSLPPSTVDGQQRSLRVPAFGLWQLWPSTGGKILGAIGRAFVKRSLVFSDLAVLILTLLVVLATGLIDFYVGKPWGTWWDMLAAIVTGAAGSAAVTSLLGAVDRLGGTATENKS